MYAKKEKIHPAYVSKRNSGRAKQVHISIIPNGEGLRYLSVKELSALLRGITSKNNGYFYCLNCLYSFRTKNKFESNKKVCENKNVCGILMPSKDIEILEFNQYKKSDKSPFIIYSDFECLIEKIDGCKNNPENSSGFLMSKISSFRSIENKLDVYRGKDFLREHAVKIIDFKKKKRKLLIKEQKESYKNAKIYYICKEKFETNI